MMEQQTLPKQQTTVERDALFPTEEKPALTTSDVIIIGENSAAKVHDSQGDTDDVPVERLEVHTVEQLFDSFYDGYVAFANDPSPRYVYHLPKKFKNDTEVYVEHNRAEVAEQKRQDLIAYARVAFINGDIQLQADNVPIDAPITVDTIAEAIVSDGIIRAQVRYHEAHAGIDLSQQPAHVSAEVVEDQGEDKSGFFDLVKSFGHRAFQTLSLHSGEVALPPTRPLPTVAIEYVDSSK
ncbi:MAG: hypothetical protein ACO1N2_01265 [Candidatus Saccharimonadota bacterium]